MIDLYQHYRPLLKDGDVLEWGSDGPIGKIIQIRTKSDVSHTSAVIWLRGRVFTIEAAGKDVHLTYLSRYMQKCRKRLYWLPLKSEHDDKRDAIVDALMDMIGIPYDYPSLFASVVCRVSSDAKRLFCSELVDRALQQAGVIPPRKKALWPGEFEKLGIFKPRVRIY